MNIVLHDPVMERRIDEYDARRAMQALNRAGSHRCLGLPGRLCTQLVSGNKPRCLRCASALKVLSR